MDRYRSSSTPTRHLEGDSRETHAQAFPTAYLVKPVAARRDFLGPTWLLFSPIRGLRLQPGLFLLASHYSSEGRPSAQSSRNPLATISLSPESAGLPTLRLQPGRGGA